MTIALEHIQDPAADPNIQRNFDRLVANVPDLGGLATSLRFGTATMTWPGGSPTATTLVISHGLGTTPHGVIATAGINIWAACITGTYTDADFRLGARTFDGTSPAAASTNDVYWIAFA